MASKTVTSKPSLKSEIEEFEQDIKKRNWLVILLLIIWWPFKIVLYPFIWPIRDFKKMSKFLVNRSNKPLDFEEIALVESTPVFFTMASVDLAIILGIIASIGFSSRVQSFLKYLTGGFTSNSISQAVLQIYDLIKALLDGIYEVVVNIILKGTWSFITSIQLDPLVLLIIAIVGAIILVAIIMIVSELDIIGRIMRKLGYFGLGIAELPRAFYDSLDHLWMSFLKKIGRFIAGDMVTSKQRNFYRRIIVFLVLYALWTFVWGILMLASQYLESDSTVSTQLSTTSGLFKQIQDFLVIILLSGFLAGTILMFVLSRVLRMVSKDRYNTDKTEVEEIRHQSFLNYMSTKIKTPALPLNNVCKLIDISKDDISSHFKDNTLKDWRLSGNAIVNDKLYKERSKYVDELVDEGLDQEEVKLLIKALDYLTFMEKGLHNVPEYVDDIADKKELIGEDIADLRGLYGQPKTQEAQ